MSSHDAEYLQALALVVQALKQDQQSYVAQMNAIEQPYRVVNRLVELLVQAVPPSQHSALASELREQLNSYMQIAS